MTFTLDDIAPTRNVSGTLLPLSDVERQAIADKKNVLQQKVVDEAAVDLREIKIRDRIERNNRREERATAVAQLEAENEI
jgi:hypothetical protein